MSDIEDQIQKEWAEHLRFMLADYRRKHPDDLRNDYQLLEDLFSHLHKSGVIKRGADGKYMLGHLLDRDVDEGDPF
jgi:hypothetical protein